MASEVPEVTMAGPRIALQSSLRTSRRAGARPALAVLPAVTLLLLLAAAPVAAQPWTFDRGDCNSDDSLTIADPIFHLGNLFAQGPAPACKDACDANDDGGADIGDPIYLLGFLFAGGPPPPAPYLVCGIDPTPDALDCVGPVAGCPPVALPTLPDLEPPLPPLAAPYRTRDADDYARWQRTGVLASWSGRAGVPVDVVSTTGEAAMGGPIDALIDPFGEPPPPRSDGAVAASAGEARMDPMWSTYRNGKLHGLHSHQVHLHNGEFHLQAVDLLIPGVGLDFIWARSYRSHTEVDSRQGNGWDHSYNIYIEEVTPGATVLMHDGNGRTDLYTAGVYGNVSADGFFQQGAFIPGGEFHVRFGDKGRWEFLPLDGSPAAGRIHRIADRNDNDLHFAYDALGRLTTITDTLDRVITVSYDGAGRIAAVTDFAGRTVSYDYYAATDAGGNEGDLAAATSPVVVGTPTGNDYPAGKTWSYTYSEGQADPLLDSNLLSITDPKGQTIVANVYDPETDPGQAGFDRLVRQTVGGPGDIIDFTYAAEVPSAANGFAVLRATENDRRGVVREYFLDAENRCVVLRHHNGFADPDQPTTATANLPGPPLRPGAPAYYETRVSWNVDHLPTQVVHPNGNITEYTYEIDIDPLASRLIRGNLRELRRLPGSHVPPGDQSQIVESFEYEPGFGGHQQHRFISRAVDARGSETLHDYDLAGNRLHTTHTIATILEDWEYDARGRVTAYTRPSHGLATQRRRDEFTYHATGPEEGYLATAVRDAASGGLALATQFSYDAVGNIVRIVDPRGLATVFTRNALDQVVRVQGPELVPGSAVRYERTLYYDANDNLVRTCVSNQDSNGNFIPGNSYITQIVEYGLLSEPVRTIRESGAWDVPTSPPQLDGTGLPASEFVTTEVEYDEERNPVLLRGGEAVNGNQPGNVVALLRDERGLLWRTVRGTTAGVQSTTQCDYDPNGNLVAIHEGLEQAPRDTLFTYDGYDRRVSTQDPMGNVENFGYDANGNRVAAELLAELVDSPGGSTNVPTRQITIVQDPFNRPTLTIRQHMVPQTQAPIGDGQSTEEVVYHDDSSVASVTDDNGNATEYSYDSIGRLHSTTDALGNTATLAYDAAGNLVSRTEVEFGPTTAVPPQTFITTYAYDLVDRLVSTTDSAGNTDEWRYDSRGNVTSRIDGRGNETRFEYDGLGRPVATERVVTDSGDGSGTVIAILTSLTAWDDSGRCIARTDANGNTTASDPDELGRVKVIFHADGTSETTDWDVHDNPTQTIDANQTLTLYTHDRNDRETARAITPGPGVSPDTTFETRQYRGDGLLVGASDDDSTESYAYDSLGTLLTSVVNGETTATQHDGCGNTLFIEYPGGRVVQQTHDALNRVSQLLDASTSTPQLMNTYEYIGPRRVLHRDCATNTRLTYEYDADRRVVRTLHVRNPGLPVAQTIDDRVYGWDAADNKTLHRVQTPGSAMHQRTMVYDSLSRLTRVLVTDPASAVIRDTVYALDGVGNRTSVTGGECSGPYTMATSSPPADFPMNQYTTTGCDLRTYDGRGNLLSALDASGGGLSHEFDHRNRIVAATDPFVGTHEYRYTATGLRFAKVVSSPAGGPQETRFFHLRGRVIEEQNSSGATIATYVHGPRAGEVLHMRRTMPGGGPTDSYFRHDDLQGVVVLCNSAGSPVERVEYGDYLEPSIATATGAPLAVSAFGNPWLATGRWFDAELGLYHCGDRALDPRAGRYVSRDPAGAWGDPAGHGNAFVHAGENPYSDVDGRDFLVWQRNTAAGDGDVDGRDYLVWQRHPAATGDGDVDGRDFLIWQRNPGASSDGDVDGRDFLVWRKSSGASGDVDGRDFLIWQRNPGASGSPAMIRGKVTLRVRASALKALKDLVISATTASGGGPECTNNLKQIMVGSSRPAGPGGWLSSGGSEAILIGMLVPAVQKVRDAAARTASHIGSANGGIWKTTNGGNTYYIGSANGGVWKTTNGG